MFKQIFLVISFSILCATVFGQSTYANVSSGAVINGITFGTALAITISWSRHQSILWAIVHGILSWLYVMYYYATRNNQ